MSYATLHIAARSLEGFMREPVSFEPQLIHSPEKQMPNLDAQQGLKVQNFLGLTRMLDCRRLPDGALAIQHC